KPRSVRKSIVVPTNPNWLLAMLILELGHHKPAVPSTNRKSSPTTGSLFDLGFGCHCALAGRAAAIDTRATRTQAYRRVARLVCICSFSAPEKSGDRPAGRRAGGRITQGSAG